MNQLICIDESSSLEFAGTEMAPQKCPKGLINKGLHRWGAFPYLLGKTRTTRQKKKMQGPMSAWRALIIDYVIGFEMKLSTQPLLRVLTARAENLIQDLVWFQQELIRLCHHLSRHKPLLHPQSFLASQVDNLAALMSWCCKMRDESATVTISAP